MKKHPPCYHGCPPDSERQNFLKCWAYENGRLCGEPATVVDPVRGCYVCTKHQTQLVESLRLEGTGLQPQSV